MKTLWKRKLCLAGLRRPRRPLKHSIEHWAAAGSYRSLIAGVTRGAHSRPRQGSLPEEAQIEGYEAHQLRHFYETQ
jgi:hypothetical protein